jgi:short-subunit dehydrogenase
MSVDEIVDATDALGEKPLALVTGASSGIGYELARVFAENGYDLVIASSNPEKLADAAESLAMLDSQPAVEIVPADLSTSDGVRRLYESVQALGRPVDLLAANAGVGVGGDFDATSLDAELALINLNVTSQVHLIKLVVRDMVGRGSGDILITSSIAGTMPGPHYAVYAASKAFLRFFGQGIRAELKDSGVNVTVLMPGPTDTEFFERADMVDTKTGQGEKQDPAEVAEAAFQALREGSDHVIPGLKNKLQAGVARLMPDEVRAKVHGAQTKRGH